MLCVVVYCLRWWVPKRSPIVRDTPKGLPATRHNATKGGKIMPYIDAKFLQSAELPEKGYKIYWDSEVKGFGLRVNAKGAKSFIFHYSRPGRSKGKLTLGDASELKHNAARKRAAELRVDIKAGIDPAQEIKDKRQKAEKEDNAPTIDTLYQEFLEIHAKTHKKERSIVRDDSCYKLHIKPFFDNGTRKIKDVTFKDVEKLHISMKDKKYTANRCHELLRTMFNKAVQWGYVEKNPTLGLNRYKEEKRERYLPPKKIHELNTYLDRHDNRRPALAVKIILLTGCRVREVLDASWSEIDLNKNTWVIPKERTKQGKDHTVYLNTVILDCLKELKQYKNKSSDFLFFNEETGKQLFTIKRFWDNARKEIKEPDLRLHDLRHTYASVLASNGISLLMIGKMLGHNSPKTTDRYAHLFDDPMQRGAEIAAKVITSKPEDQKSVVHQLNAS